MDDLSSAESASARSGLASSSAGSHAGPEAKEVGGSELDPKKRGGPAAPSSSSLSDVGAVGDLSDFGAQSEMPPPALPTHTAESCLSLVLCTHCS